MSARHKVMSVPHPYGTRSRDRAGHWEEYQREADARPWLAERQDRHHLETDMELAMLAEIDRQHPKGEGGTALGEYECLRPMRHRVWARRRPLYAEAKAAGIAIPESCDRPRGQRATALYDVLAVGAEVTSVKPGDCILANAGRPRDLGAELGTDVYEFIADVDYVDPREYETEMVPTLPGAMDLGDDGQYYQAEDVPLPPGERRAVRRRMSDTERSSCGTILAVVDPD